MDEDVTSAPETELDNAGLEGERAAPAKPDRVAAALLTASGIVVLISAFLPWFEGFTGWNIMSGTNLWPHHNVAYTSRGGLLVFTGFWAILLGILIIAGGLLLLTKVRAGAAVAVVASLLGLTFAAISVVTLSNRNLNAGAGLYIFGVFSLVSVVLGVTAVSDRGNYGYYQGSDVDGGPPRPAG